MVQRRRSLRFDFEALALIIAGGNLSRQEFDRDVALELRILGFVNDAHAAFAELGEDFVVENGFADHGVNISS
jgi:hypothetical protein